MQSKRSRTVEASPPETVLPQDIVKPAQHKRPLEEINPSTSLLHNYFQHQGTMQVMAKNCCSRKRRLHSSVKEKANVRPHDRQRPTQKISKQRLPKLPVMAPITIWWTAPPK